MKRLALLVLPIVLVACSPPGKPATPSPSPSATAASPAAAVSPADAATETQLRAVIVQTLGRDFNQPVSLQVDTLQTSGDWAWAVVTPKTPSGAPVDFSKTRYAGVDLDGGGQTYLLLQKNASGWTVRDFAVGPTDVAYMDWPQRYGAPAALLGLP